MRLLPTVFTQTALWLFLATTAYAVDVTVGTPFEIALTPEAPRQAVTFTAPEAGVFRFELSDAVGHEAQPSWLVDGASSDQQSVFAATGAAVTLTVALVGNEPLSAYALVSLSPEPFVEPNGSIADAQPIETGTAVSFRLMPRYDRDVFAVTAPEDGAFVFEFSEAGGHETTVEWLDAEGKRRAAEGEVSVYARAGETLYAQVKSAWYSSDEQGLETPLSASVSFTAEPFVEPNGSIADAPPIETGTAVSFRLMPRYDRDVFAVTAPEDGAFVFEFSETGGHETTVEWLDAEGKRRAAEGEVSVYARAGETLYAQVKSAWYSSDEQGLETPLSASVSFTAEPFVEPNGSIADAQPIETGTAVSFRLMPRRDRDVFAVTAPEDGAFVFEFSETGGHQTTVEWLDADGKRRAAEGEVSTFARAGETLYARVRSAQHSWDEQALETPLTASVSFSAEPFVEPDNGVEQAQPLTLGNATALRFMPRLDRDTYRIVSPFDGVMVLEVLTDGPAGAPHPAWLNLQSQAIASDGRTEADVVAGQTVILQLRSHQRSWNEIASTETIRFRVRLRLPDGSWADQEALAGEIVLRPWSYLSIDDLSLVPKLRVVAPQEGFYRLRVDGGSPLLAIWSSIDGETAEPGQVVELAQYDERIVTLSAVEGEGAPVGPWTVTLELIATSFDQQPGLYPRLPPIAVLPTGDTN